MMGDDDALIAEAAAWAIKRKRTMDPELLARVLELRAAYDDRSAGAWPEGAARDLVLVRWPAHGPTDVPDAGTLADTLETFWRFLRGTGRMTMASAEPAVLVKELRRALPGMADACADRSNWSQGRVFGELGASMGIDLSMSESQEELEDKLQEIMTAWNELPIQERQRMMPDASPKTAQGVAMTDALAAMRAGAYDDAAAGPDVDLAAAAEALNQRRGDPVIAARQARESPFVTACLDLARWVGPRREVTSIGVLRPALARQAYRDLRLQEWEAAHGRLAAAHRDREWTPELLELAADGWANAFSTAVDCEPLHRLWQAASVARLVDVRATVASGHVPEPTADPQWLQLANLLLVGLAGTITREAVDALLMVLGLLVEARDGEVSAAELRQRWLDSFGRAARVAEIEDPRLQATFHEVYLMPVEDALRAFADTGAWTRRDEWLSITEFGREFTAVLTAVVGRGLFDELFCNEYDEDRY